MSFAFFFALMIFSIWKLAVWFSPMIDPPFDDTDKLKKWSKP